MNALDLLNNLLDQMANDPGGFTVRKYHLIEAKRQLEAAAVPAPVPAAPAPAAEEK